MAEGLIRALSYRARTELTLPGGEQLCFGKVNGSWCIHVIRDGQRLLPAVLPMDAQAYIVELLPELILSARHAHWNLIQEINDSSKRLENWLSLMDECKTSEERQVVNDEWLNGHLSDDCAVGRVRDADNAPCSLPEVQGK